MAEDYASDVKKYSPNADDAVIAKIVKRLSLVLRKPDSKLVSCSDADEIKRVKDGWCTKVLAADSAAADEALKAVCEQMKGDRTKGRVTFYYLVAEKLGKVSAIP